MIYLQLIFINLLVSHSTHQLAHNKNAKMCDKDLTKTNLSAIWLKKPTYFTKEMGGERHVRLHPRSRSPVARLSATVRSHSSSCLALSAPPSLPSTAAALPIVQITAQDIMNIGSQFTNLENQTTTMRGSHSNLAVATRESFEVLENKGEGNSPLGSRSATATTWDRLQPPSASTFQLAAPGGPSSLTRGGWSCY